MKYILLSVFLLSSLLSNSYAQGIKASFSPQARFFQGYGNVTVNKFKDQIITISNDSTSTGTLVCAVTGPIGTKFSIIGSANFGVGAGKTYLLTIRFQPDSAGFFRDTIYINHTADTSASLKNPLRYALSGTGVAPDTFPKITVNAGGFGFLNLGNIPIGKTGIASFTIKNTSDTIRTLTGNISTPATSRFSIVSGGGAFSLDTGKLITVTVSFKPDTVANFLQDSIIISSNANSANNRKKVTLFGSGIKNDTFPQITVSGIQGSGINFRNDTLPKTKSLIFTMRNTSDSLRTLTGNVLSPPGSPFTITSGAGAFSLDSGMAKMVTVTFTPTAAGMFTDTISIATNSDSPNQIIKIPLVGVGVVLSGPRISVRPPSLNFGTLNLNAPIIPLTATIKNLSDSVKDILSGIVTMPSLPFTITAGSGNFSLAHNDSLAVTVQMATDKSGTFKDSIIITSNSNDNSKRIVLRLSGFVIPVGDVKSGVPSKASFITAMPNPFNGRVAISFSLNAASSVSMKVYDMTGKEIFTTQENIYQAGVQQIEWNANAVGCGAYLCVLTIGKETKSIRVIKD